MPRKKISRGVCAEKKNFEGGELNIVQRGNPTDPRHASGRAHRHPRADVVHARGSLQLPRTGVRHSSRNVEFGNLNIVK